MVLVNHALLLLVGVVVELAVGDTVLVDGFGTPGKRQTVAHLSGDSVLLIDAVNQLLSGESDLDVRIVRREVESIASTIDSTGHSKSPRHRAVLRLADVLTERVLLQTTLTSTCADTLVLYELSALHMMTSMNKFIHTLREFQRLSKKIYDVLVGTCRSHDCLFQMPSYD